MRKKNVLFALIMTSIGLSCLTACGSSKSGDGDTVVIDSVAFDIKVSDEYQDIFADADDETAQPEEAVEETPKPQTSAKAAGGKREKLYISGFGANGEVWGTVTMQGRTDKGTIHDALENTLSITCTRDGNELNAVDQNGRHYTFKI